MQLNDLKITTLLLLKFHKPQLAMRHIFSFYGSPIYKLSKHLTAILQLLTNKSQHKLYESTENFIDVMKAVQIPDDYTANSKKLVKIFFLILRKIILFLEKLSCF